MSPELKGYTFKIRHRFNPIRFILGWGKYTKIKQPKLKFTNVSTLIVNKHD